MAKKPNPIIDKRLSDKLPSQVEPITMLQVRVPKNLFKAARFKLDTMGRSWPDLILPVLKTFVGKGN